MELLARIITVVDLHEGSAEGVRLIKEQMNADGSAVSLLNLYDCLDRRRSLQGLLQDIERGGLVSAVRSAESQPSIAWESIWTRVRSLFSSMRLRKKALARMV
ncbi:hypothetical protein [Candidatus Magnetaquicoccus inordinatus]|uniref:hypothetical protein n=1 Tax=Candidatus Magnetaquicoccus inordinatus TaxID=2496818 RepID=UPI00102C4AAF|nr:hypothetical protein [Candidatus Magnetaquicoccus inordinatus]